MAGSRDTPTERHVSADSVRKNWPDKADPELVKRLEQLQPGHPSSPYNADGTRKPPIPDRRNDELPIPGDPEYQANAPDCPEAEREGDHGVKDPLSDAADFPETEAHQITDGEIIPPDRESDSRIDMEDVARIGSDGSWEWKGRTLTPEASRAGDHGLERWREVEGRDKDGNYSEHGLTPAMRRIEAQLEHGELAPDTEKFALKSADRLKLKLAERLALQPSESAAVLVSRIHDGIRYTFIYDDDHYTSGTRETEVALGRDGYDLITRKPSWDSLGYKGTNSQWRDPDSRLLFEVQFHTQASWQAKETTHDAYEKLADPRTTPEERARLDAYQREITASVPVPPGALEIPYYHKEGA